VKEYKTLVRSVRNRYLVCLVRRLIWLVLFERINKANQTN
jgi:hypothetical protein